MPKKIQKTLKFDSSTLQELRFLADTSGHTFASVVDFALEVFLRDDRYVGRCKDCNTVVISHGTMPITPPYNAECDKCGAVTHFEDEQEKWARENPL